MFDSDSNNKWLRWQNRVTLAVLLFAVFDTYKRIIGSDIEDSIERETTGNLENLLLAVGKSCDYFQNHNRTFIWNKIQD